MKTAAKFFRPLPIGILACFLVLTFFPIPLPFLRPIVEKEVKRAVPGSWEIGGICFCLYRGVELEKVSVSPILPSGLTVRLKTSAIRLAPAWTTLFDKVPKLSTVTLLEPTALVFVAEEDPRRTKKHFETIKNQLVHLPLLANTVSISKGRVKLQFGSDNPLVVSALDAKCSLQDLLHIKGTFSNACFAPLPFLEVEKIKGTFKLEDLEKLSIDAKGKALSGKLHLATTVSLSQQCVKQGTISIKGCDLAMLGVPKGRLTGLAALELNLDRSGLFPSKWKADGTVTVTRVSMTRFPFQESAQVEWVLPIVKSLFWESGKGRFQLAGDKVWVHRFVGNGNGVRYEAAGSFTMNGTVSQRLLIVLNPEKADDIPVLGSYVFEKERDGSRRIPLVVEGSFPYLRVTPEASVVQSVVGKTLKNIGRGFNALFK